MQIKTAATYILGDDAGRFALRLYALGDKLAWLPRSDPHYSNWLEGADRANKAEDSAEEDLSVKCWGCRSDLMLTIRFESLYILPFVEIRHKVD